MKTHPMLMEKQKIIASIMRQGYKYTEIKDIINDISTEI